MPKKIFKYPVHITDLQTIEMHKGAEILCFQVQETIHGNFPTLWAIVDPDAPKETRSFRVIGTGNPIENDMREYIGTVQMPPFVWHLFEGE